MATDDLIFVRVQRDVWKERLKNQQEICKNRWYSLILAKVSDGTANVWPPVSRFC